MERLSIESNESELSTEELGSKFNTMDFGDFVSFLREKIKENSSTRFTIVADWVDVHKTRVAKTLWDQNKSRLQIDSITIKATREQYKEDVNAFESGVEWEEI